MSEYLENKNILFVGPLPPPFFGQSLGFKKAFENTKCNKKYVVNQNFEGKPFALKVFLTVISIIKVLCILLFKKIDLIYFTCSRSFSGSIKDIFLLNIAKLLNKKTVNHIHGADFRAFFDSLPGWYKKIVFNSYKEIDVFIVLHEKLKDDILSVFPKAETKVIHNFYDDILDGFEFEKPCDGKIRLLYLSNILKSKGIIELLEAFKELSLRYDNIELSIAGEFLPDDMAGAEEIKKLFYEKINHDKIRFFGVVKGKDRAKLLYESDIFILPTYYKIEAFPLSILEAMRSGNAIITTNHNILPHIVNESNGLIIEPRSVDAVKDGVSHFIENPEKMRQIQRYNTDYAGKNNSLKVHVDDLSRTMEEVP